MNTKPATEMSQTCLELAIELTQGPRLFDDFGKPTEEVERYTGRRVLQNTERCLMAGAFRLLEWSDRQISEALKCDVRSIPLMLREAEKTGRIPALKDRLAQITGTNAERAQIALGMLLNKAADGTCNLDLAAMIKGVSTAGGIATQNLQLLTGGPTEILELRVGAGREEIEAWAKQMAVPIEAEVVTDPPIDLESAENTTNPSQTVAGAPGGHGADTSGRSQVPIQPGPTNAGPDVKEGGRGSASGPGVDQTDGSNGS